MVTRLIEHGDTLAVVIDKDTLEELNITVDTPLDVSTDGEVLIITPVRREAGREEIKESLEKVNSRYSHALKRLAEGA